MPFFDKPTMVCGMDVYHKTGNGMKSMMAFTATCNQRATKYWSAVREHDEGQEISNTLELIFTEALTEFKNKNGCYPMQVIIYRDGVGDSQRKAVLMYEIPQLKSAIEKLQL